jgi:hypothetical protein
MAGVALSLPVWEVVPPIKNKRIRMIYDKAGILIVANNDFILLLLSSDMPLSNHNY